MSKYQVADIRNIALAGHGASGKTSLADALLFQARAVDRRGNVDDGSSLSDYDDEEKKRQFSIDTSVLHLDYKGKHINLLDTPGYPDFVGSALGALDAVETVTVVLSADKGIEVNSRRMFNEAGKRELARLLIINKLDQENLNFQELIENIQATFGKRCVLFNAPLQTGSEFSGVVNLLSLPEPAPASPVNLTAARSQLIDAVVEVDEALTEKYLLEGEVTPEELSAALPQALAAGTVVPIFCTSSKKGVGLQELLDGLIAHALSPAEGKKRVAKQGQGEETSEVILEPNPEGPAVAGAFRSMTDRFVGTLSYLRIFSGTFKSDQPLFNARTGKSARTGGLFEVQGSKTEAISEAGPGDIVAVTKVDDLLVGDTAHVQADAPVLPTPVFPAPMYGLAVEPKARGDEQKISGSLTKVSNEDPTFRVTREAQTRELVITGMSQLHLDVIQSRLKRRFDLDIITHDPKIPYRETITTEAAADHRHKKQSGGRGQFGEVHLRLYPLPGDITSEEQFFEQFANKTRFEKIRVDNCDYDPEHNFGFIDTIVGGTIPNQYVPAVAKGCREVMSSGALAGYRIQGVAAEVHFGKDHPVDSSEAAFKTAGRMAFKKAFQAANPVILEPIVDLEVTIPSKYVGSILGDLNTKRARIEDQDSLPGDLTVLKAKAPLAEVMRYAAQLGSITQGSGSYAMEFSHYEQVPGNVQQQIVSKAKLAEEEED